MKLLCAEADMPRLVAALWDDEVPALLMERTGAGWLVEYLSPVESPAVAELVGQGVVSRA